MYRFIQNIGDYFNPGYFTEDFKKNVFTTSGYDNDAIKEFNKRFSGLRQKYFDYKQKVIEPALPMKYVLKHTHDFHTALLQALGYDTSEPYSQWLYLDDNRVVPVRHILKNGSQPQLLIMEMQPMIQRGDTKTEGLFEQQYSLPTDQDVEPARYRWKNWNLVDKNPIPEGCTISPKVINQAIEEIFYLPEDQRPRYVLMLAGNYVYMLEQKQFVRGSYLVFDLEELFAEVSISANRDYYALFYLLCCKQSLAAEGQSALMDKLEEESTKNAFSVTKDLKEGVIHAIEALGNEAVYYIHEVQQRDIDETDDTFEQNVKDDCITIVYRLLFLFYAEARPELGILPMDNPVYVNGYSLDKLRDLETANMQKPATQNGYFIHDSIWRLFSMIHNGYNESLINKTKEAKDNDDVPLSRTFAVKKIDSPLFRDDSLKVLRGVKYRNVVWQSIIRELSITKPDSMHKTVGRISYANLGINQLGSVYESLLAFRGFYAEQNYMEVFKAGKEDEGTYLVPTSRADDFHEDEKKYNPDGSLFTIPKGTFIYRLNGRDRKKSASYYTPEVLTQSTVKYTLKGFVDRLKDPDDSFCAQDLLKLKILEPAMGAAAFQNEAINQLAELYITYREKELGKHVPPTSRRDEIQRVKAYIATKNVYGVDLNPTAIELGKLSLWLNVMHHDMETPYFGHRIALGNAVIGAWLKVYSKDELFKKENDISNKPICTEWWTKSPHKVHFDTTGKKIKRRKDEIYHFLLPDKNMLGVLSITELKKANPEAAKRMNRIKKDWIRPLKEEDIIKLEKLSEKVDTLLTKYQQYQTKVDELTGNNFTVWGQNHKPAPNFGMTYDEKQQLTDTRNSRESEYYKLKTVMDYWCSLWFWDYEDADLLPTREEYWGDINGILGIDLDKAIVEKRNRINNISNKRKEQTSLIRQYELKFNFDDVCVGEPNNNTILSNVPSKEEANNILSQYKDKGDLFSTPRTPIIKKLAERYHFFHPMLEFIEVFWLRDGFYIILGNPPWIKLEFDEQGIISERFPEVEIRKISATNVRKIRERLFMDSPEIEGLYYNEETENAGDSAFTNACSNYPLLQGQQTNLYKCILENGFDELSNNGFMGMLHPESIFDDPKGQQLRRAVYHHLRYHFQYENELNLFTGTNDHGRMKFGENIYGPYQEHINFMSMSNVFAPSTVDKSFTHDGHGICGGIKDENGKWNINPHKERIVQFGEKELKVLANAFENGADWECVKLTSIHAKEIINVLADFAEFPTHVSDYNKIISEGLHEVNSQDKGIMRRNTTFPDWSKSEMIYSGPHVYVSNPYYKTPRSICNQNSDYDIIDLQTMQKDYTQRTNYTPTIELEDYLSLFKGFEVGKDNEGNPIYDNLIEHYKIGYRRMIGTASERTFSGAILPPNAMHIGGIVSITFKDNTSMAEFLGLSSSLPLDFFIKVLSITDIHANRLLPLPLGIDEKYKLPLISRTLILNCLSNKYSALWQELWREEYKDEEWSINDPRLKPFNTLKKDWEWATPLRNYFERRQALVEIDVISAMALGLSLKDLEMIYTIQFPVLQQNESDTWYDQKGNIVFTCSKGLTGVGCDRKEWESIRNNSEPYVHTIDPKKSELYGGQQVTYYPPYTRPDRISDYRRAWAFFEKKFNNK